ncbi:MAG: WD40 repeat domain-containing protein, partial [Anaerolineales bacterium]
EPLVTDIIARLTAADPVRLLTIIGPSGSGKSSLVGAGVVPALREQTQPWYVAQMTPGAAPLETLAETMRTLALAPYAGVLDWQDPTTLLAWLKTSLPQNAPILLVIDQFEALFTQTAPRKQQRAFIDNLVTAVEAKCLFVVLVLRADFYDRPMQFPALAPYLRQQTIIVLPLTESELERVIVAPAQRAGVNIQSELVLRLIFDMHQQPGALPLLQFTLTELVERAGTQPVTLDTYNLLGGISGTLALRADQLFLAMPEEWQPLMRRIFLQLITLDEDSTATRRRVTWQALDALTDQQMILQKILDTFGAARLVTFDRDPTTRLPTVEIAHEALIGAWGRLQAWLDDARLLLRTTQQLEFAVREWESHRQEASYLASGARLASFEDLATQTERPLDARARAFLGASLAQRGRYRARVRLAVVSLVVLVMLTSSLALVAVNQQSQAIEARNQADAQAALARSRELAALALLQTDQPDIAALLALASQEQATTFEAQHSLLTVLQEAAPRQYTLHHGEPVRALARSADGRYMATGGADGTLVWWDVLRQVRVAERSAALTGRVHSLAVHADWIAAGGVDGALTLWNPRTDDIQHLAAHGDDVWAVAWHPSGGRLASAGADGEIILWAVPSGEIQHRWAAHAETIFALAWHPDGEWLASGGANRDLVLWQAEDRRAHRTWQAAHEDWILALAFSADGTLLASGGAEAALAIWSPAQASALLRFESDHQDWVRDLDFHPTEPWLLSAGQDGSVQVWDALRGAALRAPLHAVSAVWAARFSADGTLIFSGDAAGQIAAWDWTQTLPYPAQGQLANTGQMIHDLLIRPVEGDVIIATGDAATPTSQPRLQHWSEAQGLVAHRSAQQGVVTSLALHPRGHLLAAGHADHQIGLWSLADWRPSTPALRGHIAPVFDLAFNPTGEYLASAGDDGRVVIWDAASDEPLHTLEDASAGVLALAFSPAGDYLVAGDRTGVIYIWDDSWQTPARLMAHDEAITSLAFHPAQPWLASGSRDGRIIIWDYQKGQIVRRLGGHAHWVMSLAFSPDGRLLASGGRDELLRLWHVALGRQLGDSLSSGGGWVTALAFSPDGDALVTGTSTGIIERWDVANAAWRERACAIANRELAPAEQGQFGLDAANFCALPTG